MKFIDLFAGIGGFHYAIKSIDKTSKPVMVSEIDKYAKEAYSKNHSYDINEIRNIRDYTDDSQFAKEKLKQIGKYDILFGGFPCQTFSTAGKKEGFLDEVKGTLFFDVAKLLGDTLPKYVLLENVKHLAKHDDGHTWEVIKETLRDTGYLVPDEPILLSPHQFGIPQIRWRVFIPAILKTETDLSEKEFSDKFNFDAQFVDKPKKLRMDKVLDDATIIKDKKILNSLKAWGEFIEKVRRPRGRTLPVIWLDYMNEDRVNLDSMPSWKSKYIRDMRDVYFTNKEFIDGWMKKHEVSEWQKRERKLEWQAGADKFDHKNTFVQLRQSGYRFKKPNIFPTLVAMVQTSILFDNKINKWRYLSVDEVKRLQSFPNSFKYCVPEYQTYKQFGNSINVKVAEIVLSKLLSDIIEK